MFEVSCVLKDVLHLRLHMFSNFNVCQTKHIEFTQDSKSCISKHSRRDLRRALLHNLLRYILLLGTLDLDTLEVSINRFLMLRFCC
jgi:hypothetical protein